MTSDASVTTACLRRAMLTDQKILLAGFSSDECFLIESTLTRAGFSVCHIDWKDAVPQEKIACVILDLSGGEFDSASNLLRQPSLVQAGCISILPPANDHARLLAMTMGTDDIVYQPIHYKELIAKVSILIDKYLDRSVGTNTVVNDDIDLIQRLQDLATTRYTGSVKLSGRDGRTAHLCFDKGAIAHAAMGIRDGAKAIASLWRVIPAQLELIPEMPSQPSIVPPLDVNKAVATIAATIQTFQHISKPSPLLSSVCSVDWNLYRMTASKLPRQVRDLMPAFDGSKTLEHLLDSVPLDEQLLVKILAKLARESILIFSNRVSDDLQLEQWVNSGSESYASLPPVPVASAAIPAPDTSRFGKHESQDGFPASDKGFMASEGAMTSASQPSNQSISLTELSADDLDPNSGVLLLAEDLEATRLDIPETPSVEEKLQEELISLCKSGELFKVSTTQEAVPSDARELQAHLRHLEDVQETDVSIPSVTIYRNDATPSETGFSAPSALGLTQPLPEMRQTPVVATATSTTRPPLPNAASLSKPSTAPLPGLSLPKKKPQVSEATSETATATTPRSSVTSQASFKVPTAETQASAEEEKPKKSKRNEPISTSDPQYFPSFHQSSEEEDEEEEYEDEDVPDEPIRHSDDHYQVFQRITDEEEEEADESDDVEGQFFNAPVPAVSTQSNPSNLRTIPTPEEWQKLKLEKTRNQSLKRHQRQQLIFGVGIVVCIFVIIALLVFQGEDESANNPGTTVGATHDEKSGNRDVERDEQRDDSAKDRHSDAVALQDADSDRGRVEENAEANGGRGAALDSDDDDDDDASDHDDRDDADDAAADPALKDNGSDSANAAGTDKAEDASAQAAGTDPTSLVRENASDQGSSDRAAQPSEDKAATAPTEVARHHADAKSDTAAKTTSRTRSSSKNNAASDAVVKPKATVIMPDGSSATQNKTSSSKSSKSAGSQASSVPLAALLGQAQQALRAGKVDEARTALAPALKSSPNDSRVNTLAARIEAKAGNYDKAIAYIQKTESQNKGKPSYWKELGTYQQSSGKTAEARASYQKAYDLLDPESTEAQQLLNKINKL